MKERFTKGGVNIYNGGMTFWIDGDSCPREVRDLVGKTAKRLGQVLRIVANREIPVNDAYPHEMIVLPVQEGAADAYLLEHSVPGDLVVTRDIPLAALLTEKSILVLNDRGDVFTPDFLRERLSVRAFSLELKAAGLFTPSRKSYDRKDYQAFAKTFDREVHKLLKESRLKRIQGGSEGLL